MNVCVIIIIQGRSETREWIKCTRIRCSEEMARELEFRAAAIMIMNLIIVYEVVDQMLTVISRSSASTRGAGAADTVTRKPFFSNFVKKKE